MPASDTRKKCPVTDLEVARNSCGILRMTLIAIIACILLPALSLFSPSAVMADQEEKKDDCGQEVLTGLKEHVHFLAGKIGPRNLWRNGSLEAAAGYIEWSFRQIGFEPQSLPFKADDLTVRNIEAVLPGLGEQDGLIIVGAHYDTVPGTAGANDNASGVAAMLETARLLSGRRFQKTVRFVAFVNEEPPFFKTGGMGSRVYARSLKKKGEKVEAMFSIETVGFYSDAPGSQHYPFPLGFFYPDTGNFIAFVSNMASGKLLDRSVELFKKRCGMPVEKLAMPSILPGIDWSDHWSFWQEGWPAIMVTDTALYRYDHYHMPSDTPDKIDFYRLCRVTEGLAAMTGELAGSVP